MLELRNGSVRLSSLRSSTLPTSSTYIQPLLARMILYCHPAPARCSMAVAQRHNLATLFFGGEFADLLLERVILLDQRVILLN